MLGCRLKPALHWSGGLSDGLVRPQWRHQHLWLTTARHRLAKVQPQAMRTVVGLGDPVMDILVNISTKDLAAITSEPGGCIPVSRVEMEKLLGQAGSRGNTPLRVPGGSAANVMKGLASVSTGTTCCKFVGMVGQDATGKEYRDKLHAQGVEPLLLESTDDQPSASSLCLVTPDGQRTMRTCLGASLGLFSVELLPPSWLQGASVLHCEGYCLYRPRLAVEALRHAKKTGALVSIDLASFELVRNCKDVLLQLLHEGIIDLVFANEEEARELALQLGGKPDEAEDLVAAAQKLLLQYVSVSVVSLGSKGCVARNKHGEVGRAPGCRVEVQDTIGAGDFFTAGFLHGFLQAASLQQCAACGCAVGAEAVQATGADLASESWERVNKQLHAILERKDIPQVFANGSAAAAAAPANVISFA